MNSEIIELSYDCDNFKDHWYYKAIVSNFNGNINI